MARVQFVEENVSFVEVRHDGQGVVHVALIERGELVFLISWENWKISLMVYALVDRGFNNYFSSSHFARG